MLFRRSPNSHFAPRSASTGRVNSAGVAFKPIHQAVLTNHSDNTTAEALYFRGDEKKQRPVPRHHGASSGRCEVLFKQSCRPCQANNPGQSPTRHGKDTLLRALRQNQRFAVQYTHLSVICIVYVPAFIGSPKRPDPNPRQVLDATRLQSVTKCIPSA